jgi:pilus assembly protein CpaB
MVEAVETPDSPFAPAQERFESVEKVTGRVTGKAIPKDAPVLKSMLAPEGTPAGMVGRIPAGFRAVSVKIDEVTGVAFQIQPGDWVDVIVVMDVDVGARRKETIAEVILQHVQVAAIGRGSSPEANPSNARMQPAKSATLLVREPDVPKLHLAATRGKITLAMRGDDAETSDELPFARSDDVIEGLKSLFNTGPTAAVPPTPKDEPPTTFTQPRRQELPPPHEVVVYRGAMGGRAGSNIERITFENAHSPNILEVNQGNPTRQLKTLDLTRPRSPRRQPPQQEPGTTDNDDSSSPED